MIKINLLSEGKRAVRSKSKPAAGAPSGGGQDVGTWLLVVGLLLGIVGLVGYWWYWNQKIAEKQAEVDQAQQEVTAMANVIKEVEDYKAKKKALESKIGVI